MRSLPLFHRLAGRPVIVLGDGALAEPKIRLVERAGGQVISDIDEGIARGARIAFVAHEDQARCSADAVRLQIAGLLVNVVDRPELCDFTTPSILERDPVLLAIGTSGASAGLSKQLRLRLEALIPADLGALADALYKGREAIRRRWPGVSDRRRALDAALGPGGPLDPLQEGGAGRIEPWLEDAPKVEKPRKYSFLLDSDDPEELTLRQARLLGSADVILHDPAVPSAVLDRARADARRIALPYNGPELNGLVIELLR